MPLYGDKGAVVPFRARPLPGRKRTKASVAESPLNVLVIACSSEERMAVRIALEAGGFVLQEAANAERGLKLAGSAGPDCILLDDVLPDSEGLGVLQSLRQPGGALPCAVVMLTQARTADIATAAIKAGALDYVDKDHLDADTLRRAIRGAVRQFRLIEAQRVAERRNAQLAAIVAASGDAIVSVGTDLTVQTWNAAAQRLFGYGETEAHGRTILELIVPEAYEAERSALFAAAMSSKTAMRKETVRRHKDGHLVPAETNISPILDGSGDVTGFSIILRDISERKRMEARLAEREAQLALFVEHAPAAIAMFDTNMICLAASRRFISDHRVPDTVPVIGVSIYETLPEIPPRWREVHARVLAGEELSHDEDPFLRLDGDIDWCRWSMKPWRTPDGRVGGALLFSEVITAQVEAKRALAESEARFRATFENAAVGIAHLGPDYRWLRANGALCRILGYSLDEFVTKSLQDITHPDDLAISLANLERMRNEKIESYNFDKRYLRKDGSIVWARLTVGCVRKSDGSIDYYVSVVEDITARKHAEEELRKSEQRFRSSLLHSPLPILLFDDREQILALSESWIEQSGYAREELRSIPDWTVRAYGECAGQALEHIRRIISKEPEAQSTERMIRTGDGRQRLWSFVNSALGTQSDGRHLFVCMAQDVTERKAHEEQIHLLMREVNHRAKNMLSLVQAIARQTAAREPEDFIALFTERIQALAANQDLLVGNEWRGVDVEDLTRAQLAHFADLVGSRIVMRGPKLRLNAAAAQAIGLALHELATNAGKYGALSVRAGRVDVGWQRNDDIFAISWSEHNGPTVSPPEQRGFGSTVIASMAKLSVGGEVQLDYAPSGLTWSLSCPAANALESSPALRLNEGAVANEPSFPVSKRRTARAKRNSQGR